MKKLIFSILTIAGMMGVAHADLFDRQKGKEYTVYFSSTSNSGISGTTTYVLIDLSDTTNWPHKEKSEIHITSIEVDFDKVAASTTSIRFGVVNFVSTNTGSVTWFASRKSTLNVSNTITPFQQSHPDYGINTKVIPSAVVETNGTTPYILSTDVTSNSTAFQTDVLMPTIRSTSVYPAVGDIFMEIDKAAVNINFAVTVRYFSE